MFCKFKHFQGFFKDVVNPVCFTISNNNDLTFAATASQVIMLWCNETSVSHKMAFNHWCRQGWAQCPAHPETTEKNFTLSDESNEDTLISEACDSQVEHVKCTFTTTVLVTVSIV